MPISHPCSWGEVGLVEIFGTENPNLIFPVHMTIIFFYVNFFVHEGVFVRISPSLFSQKR